MITVIIATRNRPTAIRDCVASLMQSVYPDFEIIIADQSTDGLTKNAIRSFRSGKIHYFRHTGTGKTKAVNTAIRRAKGSVLSFIDDDNIVQSDWLTNIHAFMKTHRNAEGVFGTILPYKPDSQTGYRCPSVFRSDHDALITDPYSIHHQILGLGSNMSLRKSVFSAVGMFRPWLGPGAFGFSGGEDGDLIYRILRRGYSLAHNKRITVFHNRWLTDFQFRLLQTRYTAGETAYMVFYSFKGDRRMLRNVRIMTRDRLLRQGIRESLKTFLHKPGISSLRSGFLELIYMILEAMSILKGAIVGTYAFITTPASDR